jgi:cold-inducible RNA-binding protein
MKKLFVGNLDFHVSEDEVRQLFAAYGPVDRVDIIKDRDTGQSRGFGFVEMANAADAEDAIAGLNGEVLGDRSLHVNEAHRGPARTERQGSPASRRRSEREIVHCGREFAALRDRLRLSSDQTRIHR